MKNTWVRTARTIAVAASVSAVLAACGGGGTSSTSAGGPTGELDPAAVLRITASAPTRNLDPYLQTSYGGWGYITPVYDRLMVVDGDGNLQPALAESWEFASDGKYLELRLRTDVTFHDGTPFDAAAVAANIERGKTMAGSTVVSALADVTGVEIVDAHTVRLMLAPGSGVQLPGTFTTNVGMMVSPKAIASGADLRTAPGDAGSGAYLVDSYVPEESLTLVRAEGTNWDPEAGKVASIRFEAISDASTRLNGMKTGATDLTWVSSANEVVEAQNLGASGSFDVDEVKFRNVLGLYMRPQGDLAKPEARQAVATAIDPAAIDALFSGTCTPNRQLYPSGSWSVDESYRYPYEYDVDRARSLAEAAGGPTVTLTFAAGTNTEKSANVLQSQLAEAGITAELNPVPNVQNEPRYIAGDFQSMVANSFSPKVDPADTVNQFVTGPYDLGNGNPQIAELAEKAADPALTPDERAPLYRQIWDLTLKEAMFVPICNQTNASVSNGKVTGLDDMPWVDLGIFDVRHVGMVG
ncbi:ABC transporter substrate-binding protein [Rhodococcus sp. NPDC003382]